MNHNRLKCYGILMDVARKVPDLVAQLPRGEGYLVDQLKRALASAILNLSEGNGRRSQKERARFFDISLASIAETASAIDILLAYDLVSMEIGEEIKSKLRIAYAMIMKLRKSGLCLS